MKLPHNVITRSPSLLPMLYKPAELAEEIKVPKRTLYDWLKLGAPHQRDELDHIWIEGRAFASWVENNRKKKVSPRKLMDNEAICLRCNMAVSLLEPETIPSGKGRLYYIKGTCPTCGNKIVRGGSKNGRPL